MEGVFCGVPKRMQDTLGYSNDLNVVKTTAAYYTHYTHTIDGESVSKLNQMYLWHLGTFVHTYDHHTIYVNTKYL